MNRKEGRAKRAEALSLFAKGLTQKAIAKKLDVSEVTVCAWMKEKLSKSERLFWLNKRLDTLITEGANPMQIKRTIQVIKEVEAL